MIGLKQFMATFALSLMMASPSFATVLTFEDVKVKFEDSPLYGTAQLEDGYGGISGWNNVGKVFGYADGLNEGLGSNNFYGGGGELTFDNAPVIFQGTYYKSYAYDQNEDPMTSIELFYKGVSVYSILDPRSATGLQWVSSGYSGLVDKIVFRGGMEGFAIDNLTYSVSAVPEPSPAYLWLLGGLAILGITRRRHPTDFSRQTS